VKQSCDTNAQLLQYVWPTQYFVSIKVHTEH